MRVLGIIAEYNPFHNGHLYHLNKSIEVTGATHTVAVMSGNFIQRGGPAIVNKWARAEMAVKSGVDLVLELPAVYACGSAEDFALGALSVLNGLGSVNFVCFGSEAGNLQDLKNIANILAEEPDYYKELLRGFLSEGNSYPLARALTLEKYLNHVPGDLSCLLKSPNNILAIEYLKTMKRLKCSITPYTIKRCGAGYCSGSIGSNIASATAIRREIIINNAVTYKASKALPSVSAHILKRELRYGRGPVFYDLFSLPIITLIRRCVPKDLTKYPGVTEGIENRIHDAAKRETTVTGMLNRIKTKRYTYTRLSRILTDVLLNITKEFTERLKEENTPCYARVLALNEKGGYILRQADNKTFIPKITKFADHGFSEGSFLFNVLQKDATATDLYTTVYANDSYSFAGQDFVTSPFFLYEPTGH